MVRAHGIWRLIVVGTLALIGAAGYFGGLQLWAAYHYRQALHALQDREFRQAADHLERVLEVWPHDPAVHLLAAQAARRQGDMAAASPHLGQCVRQAALPEAVALEYRLWQVQNGELSDGRALLRRAQEQPDAAETPLILEALIEGCLKVLAALGSMGLPGSEVAEQPELASARHAVDIWLERRPGQADQVQGLVWRGRVHDIADEHAQAVADLRCAVELDPQHFQPRWYLAASIGQEAPQEAADQYASILERDPENQRVRLLLAVGRHGLGQFEEARQLLDELLAANPKNFPALVERGRLALDAQQPAEAEASLRRAEALAPDHADVNLQLGRTLQLLGRTQEAQRYQERFRQIDAAQKRERDERVAKLKSMQQSTRDK